MSYVEGFVVAVPTDKKDEYLRHAAEAVPIFKDFGVTRHVEAWGDDVPDEGGRGGRLLLVRISLEGSPRLGQ